MAESLSQHDEKHVVPTALSGVRVEEEEDLNIGNVLKVTIEGYFSIIRILCSGETPRTAPRIPHAFITLYNKYTYRLFTIKVK
jgi:hypothetical protein